MPEIQLHLGDCLEILPTLADASIDAIITDPPYPEIDRPYGRMTEPDWHAMMDIVIRESRRILKPKGSAVFILQANSERVGRMRSWLWEFMAKTCREWNQVQDVWWWNWSTPPTVHCHRDHGLMRPSLKACVWLGASDCFRNQDDILQPIAEATLRDRRLASRDLERPPSGNTMRRGRALQRCRDRGGATPFNVLPLANSNSRMSMRGHGATTPMSLCDWWVRYISTYDGVVLDPFSGTGTVGLAALNRGRSFIGIERQPKYHEIAQRRIAKAQLPLFHA